MGTGGRVRKQNATRSKDDLPACRPGRAWGPYKGNGLIGIAVDWRLVGIGGAQALLTRNWPHRHLRLSHERKDV